MSKPFFLSDEKLEAMARVYCNRMGLDPDEEVVHEPLDAPQFDIAITYKRWQIVVPKVKQFAALIAAVLPLKIGGFE